MVEEKATIVRRLLQEVELGVEEAAMMSQLASHLSGLEGERAKLRAQVKRFKNNFKFVKRSISKISLIISFLINIKKGPEL